MITLSMARGSTPTRSNVDYFCLFSVLLSFDLSLSRSLLFFLSIVFLFFLSFLPFLSVFLSLFALPFSLTDDSFFRYHLSKKVPAYVRMLAPNGALVLNEEAWNGYPYCKTILTNEYMKENFKIIIESMHLPDNGKTENALKCPPEVLKKRSVEVLNIADATIVESKDYKEAEDPAKFHSEKTGRGPLDQYSWIEKQTPVMTCYKLVTCEFKWFGLQTRVEQFIQKTNRNLLSKFHRQVFCYLDKWHGMTMDDIRRYEEQTKHDLAAKINTGSVTNAAED